MSDSKEFFVHPNPVWRERSNFIINAELQEQDRPRRFEQLWTRRVGENRFEVCCIPFHLYDVMLGDVVSMAPKHGRTYIMDRVVEPSGRYAFRVWLGGSSYPRDTLAQELKALGSLIEWYSGDLLAVDAADGEHAQVVADFLAEREEAGQLEYETGRTK